MEQQTLASNWIYSTTASLNKWGRVGAVGSDPKRYTDGNNFPICAATSGGTHIGLFLCPSNPGRSYNTWNGSYLLHNYVGNFGGNSTSSTHSQYLVSSEPFLGAPFECKSIFRQSGAPTVSSAMVSTGVRFAQITDGTSNTLLFSEVITGLGGTSDMHGLVFGAEFAGFVTYATPNSQVDPDQLVFSGMCGTLTTTSNPYPCQASTNTTTTPPRMAARSGHTGGVNAALCDGTVRFFTDSINGAVWKALGTARGAEVISLSD